MPAFTIDQNAPILVEFAPRPGVQQVALIGDGIEKLTEKSAEALDGAMNTIHHMARRVNAAVHSLPQKPSTVEVEFGLKFDAEAGAILSKAGMEASVNIKLVWGQ